jgi:exocyst complex component 6
MIDELNDSVQEAGTSLLHNAESLMQYRYVRRNLEEGITVSTHVLDVVTLANKAQQQIIAQKYFPALKTIDQVQRIHMPRIAEHAFAKTLENSIRHMISHIRDNALSDFSNWLSQTSERAGKLGSLLLEQTDKKMQLRARYLRDMMDEHGDEKGFDLKTSMLQQESHWDDKGVFEKVDLDFAPVYQCFHVFERLNMPSQFQSEYVRSRRDEAVKAMDIDSVSKNNQKGLHFVKSHMQYFARVTGFFAIEDTVLKSGSDLMSRAQVDDLWELAVSKIKQVMGEQLAYVLDPTTFLSVRKSALLFCKTLENHGFFVTLLLEFIASQKQRFEMTLFRQLDTTVSEILANEKYEPLVVENQDDYDTYVLAYWLQEDTKSVEFPVTLPFSISVPMLCRAVKLMIADYLTFASDLNTNLTADIYAAIDAAFEKSINGAIQNLIANQRGLKISQAAQFAINCQYLVSAVDWAQHYLDTHPDVRQTKRTKLMAAQSLRDTQMQCSHQLFELVDSKVDLFLGLAEHEINWTPNGQMEHGYAFDLVNYLETTFVCMEHLPMLQGIHFASCKHICSALVNMMMDDEVKSISIIALLNLHGDLEKFEQFAERTGTDGLPQTFSELRQMLNLFLSGNVEQILDSHIRDMVYPHISPERLVKLMNKYQEGGRIAKNIPDIRDIKTSHVRAVAQKLALISQQV